MDLYLAIVPLVLLASALGPGFLLVRRRGLDRDETLAASLAVSLLLLALESFLIFVLALPPIAHVALLALNAALTLLAVRDLAAFLRGAEAQRLLGGFALLAAGCLAGLGLIRAYSGGMWYGDWLEHYQRSRFFLGDHPLDETFLGYALPARPPLANLIGAHLLAIAGDRFRVYQLGCALLSLLIFFPAWLLFRLFRRPASGGAGGSPALLAAFLLLCPLVVQNVTYCWTKLPAAFFLLTGLYFHLTGRGPGGRPRRLLASASLAAAILTHYSAIPYAAFLLVNRFLFWRADSGRGKATRNEAASIGELALCALIFAIVLGPWLGWSAAHYGPATIAATSTVRDAAALSLPDNLLKIARNLRDTVIPPVLRGRPVGLGEAIRSWGRLREAAFNLYQMNLFFAAGIVSPLLLLRELRRPRVRPRRWFWPGFILFNVLAGVSTHGTAAPLGLAHVSLQPLVLLAVIFFASRFATWGPFLRAIAIGGAFVDAALGIVLHLWLESIPLRAMKPSGALRGLTPDDLTIGSGPDNWVLQLQHRTVFIGADLRDWRPLLLMVTLATIGAALLTMARVPGDGPPLRRAGDFVEE